MGELTTGKHTYGNPIRRGVENSVTFGSYCSIAQGVLLDGGFNHEARNVSTYPFHSWYPECKDIKGTINMKGDIIVGNDVWIGEDAVLMSGIKIGHGAVVGIRSVVTKDVKPYEIVGGIPAKHIRFRFSEHIIERLLKLNWWDKTDEEVIKIAPLLASNRVEELLAMYGI